MSRHSLTLNISETVRHTEIMSPSRSLTRSYVMSEQVNMSSKCFSHRAATRFTFCMPNDVAIFRQQLPNWHKCRKFQPVYRFGIDDCSIVECRRQFRQHKAEASLYGEHHSDQAACIFLLQMASTSMPKKTVQNLIVHTENAEANKKTAPRHFTVVANCRQTRSIVRSLCNSKASCPKLFHIILNSHPYIARCGLNSTSR